MNNISDIFSSSTCPSSEELLQYVKGVLGEPDKKRVQRHLADCVMCSDEVEGLEAMSNPDNIVHIEDEINHKIDEKLIEKKIRWIPFFKVAASIFLIAG
ncbi:MAG: hypothetical protein PHT69_15240, partial [Bacteroidales bacterium]|nr:hypothetical protein [Bacteroidales bacterium]